jgi:hypothetical protein
MNDKVNELVERIRTLEEEVEGELRRRRAELNADFESRKVRFEREVIEQQRRFKAGLAHYIFTARPAVALTAPVIYAVFFALLALDLAVGLYQLICFPIYGIPRVRRRDYLIFDRGHLAYLNALEKLNCIYCSYGNGLAAYVKEVVARTEQYWCPIKHARRVLDAHSCYNRFADFGDAESYRTELEKLRRELEQLHRSAPT